MLSSKTKLLIALSVCINWHCTNQTLPTNKARNKVYITENIKCEKSWDAKIRFDTMFTEKIGCRIGSFCKSDVNFIDTIELENDTFLIRKHHDIEFHVLFTPNWSAQVIDKSSFLDSLAEDLKDNGFMTPPFDLEYHSEDTSISFKTFIGHADSDVGDVYVLRIDKSRKPKVIAVEISDTNDE